MYLLNVKCSYHRDDLTKDNALQYLTMCLKESMRLFPPVPVIGRRLTKDTDFAGKTMPPGMFVLTKGVLFLGGGGWTILLILHMR